MTTRTTQTPEPDPHLSARPVRPTEPRLAPLAPDELDDNQADAMRLVGDMGETTNIFATLVRHPGLFRKWVPFGGKLLSGKLPARDRELLILRVGWRCHAEYEWAQHVRIGLAAGLTADEIESIKDGPGAERWTDLEAMLLRAVDELVDDSCISDVVWAELAASYDDKQLIEIPMVVGHYLMVSCILNTLGVSIEDGVAGFDATAPSR